MRGFLIAVAIAFAPSPLDAYRSFACSPGYSWIQMTVGTTEIVEIRSQPMGVSVYYNDMNCTLILTAESSSDHVTVDFSMFRMRAPDTVMLYDGAKVVDGWMNAYGAVGNPFTTTLTPTLRVNMLTDAVFSSQGFVANVYVSASPATASPMRPSSGAAPPNSATASSGAAPPSSATASSGAAPPSSATASSGAAPTPSFSSQSLSSPSWQTSSRASSSSSSVDVLTPTSRPLSTSKDSVSSLNASSGSSSVCSSCQSRVSTPFASPQTRNAQPAPGLLSTVSAEIRYSSSFPARSRGSQGHFYIKYLPGSQIPAFHISIPIVLSYSDAPSRWANGDFGAAVLGLASILGCDPDRIQNAMLRPISRVQSELELLMLSSRDVYDTSALFLGTQLSYHLQNLSSPLRSIEIFNLVPDPPVNVTMKEILVTICSNSTYAIDHCPGSDAELASVSRGRIANSDFVMVTVFAVVVTVLVASALYIWHCTRRQPYKMSGSQAITPPEAINCEDFEPPPGQNATKHRTNLSFALPNANQHYQVKRGAYDKMQRTLAHDDKHDQNYMKKRQGSFHFSNDDGNISAME